jgi:hypothetical protein
MVKFWGKNEETKELPDRPDRIKNMSDADLRSWLNATLMEMGAVYDRWAFSRGESEEFTKVLEIVNNLWNELQSRTPK